jgi:hypothetical protein
MGQELNSAMRTFLRILWMALVLLIVGLLSALTTMRLAIHGGEVTVPDFQGKSPSEARRIADDNGLAAQIEREYYSPAVPRGRILSQMPAPGTIVRRGWELRLALSLGPQRVAIPQVVGESARAAAISIEQRGFNRHGTEFGSASRSGYRAKPFAQRHRYRGSQNQPAGGSGRPRPGVRDAQLHRTTAGKRHHHTRKGRLPRPRSDYDTAHSTGFSRRVHGCRHARACRAGPSRANGSRKSRSYKPRPSISCVGSISRVDHRFPKSRARSEDPRRLDDQFHRERLESQMRRHACTLAVQAAERRHGKARHGSAGKLQ